MNPTITKRAEEQLKLLRSPVYQGPHISEEAAAKIKRSISEWEDLLANCPDEEDPDWPEVWCA